MKYCTFYQYIKYRKFSPKHFIEFYAGLQKVTIEEKNETLQLFYEQIFAESEINLCSLGNVFSL